MTLAAIFDQRGTETKMMRGLTCIGEVGREHSVRLGYAGRETEGYEAPDLLLVCQRVFPTPPEVIAESYRRHGARCVRYLAGPCSFALYDRDKQLLIATSDITSRVPLAYWIQNGTVAVSSRVQRLLGHADVARQIDDGYLAHLVTGYWSAPPGRTPIRDVKRLAPGVALIVERGRVRFDLVDELAPVGGRERAKEYWIGALWTALEGAAARSLTAPAPCLSLSGGLDSAVIAAAAAPSAERPLTTFSMVGPSRDSDEEKAIDAVARSFALINERVECDGDLHGLDALELPDDPSMTPLSLLPSRLRLWRSIATGGFGTVVDGEGADELFGMAGPRHAILERRWGAALRYVQAQPGGRRFLFTRSVLLPTMPRMVTHLWARRLSDAGERLPTFMTTQARADPVIQEAGRDFYCGQVDEDLPREFLRWLSMPAIVGAAATHQHLASLLGLGLSSPMLDRRVVEVVLSIPAEHLLSSVRKGFLRDAARGRVPDEVRTRPKDIQWSEQLVRRILGSRSVRDRVRDPIVRERFDKWIRFERLESMLDEIVAGHELSNRLWQQVEGAVSCAYWYSRASRELGVT